MLRRLWAPAAGPRERTAATALLLVLVIGAAHATRGDRWPARSLMKCDVSAAVAPVELLIPIEHSFGTPARPPLTASPVSVRRVLSVADAELPPVRAPNRF